MEGVGVGMLCERAAKGCGYADDVNMAAEILGESEVLLAFQNFE